MNRPAWLDELALLAARFGSAMGPDLVAMNMAELWGLYLWLRAVFERGS